MNKQEKIVRIESIIIAHGNLNAGQLLSENELCINTRGKGKSIVTELIAFLYSDHVSTAICHNGQEIACADYDYEELSDEIIDEIYDSILKYEGRKIEISKLG